MYQMSCNRSAGTGENQIIWCGWAAAAGKRCGRAAGGLPASLRRGAEGLPAQPRSQRAQLRFSCRSGQGSETRGGCRLRGARPSPAKRRSPGRHLRARGARRPLGRAAGLRSGSAGAEARPAPAKHVQGNGTGRTTARSCMTGLPFPSGADFRSLRTPLPGLGLAKGLSPCRHRCRRARPAPADPGARRPRDAPPRRAASRAPASLDGQHLPKPGAVSRQRART